MSPISTVSMTFTSVPLTDNTLIDLSARLVTSARLPAGLKLRAGCCLAAVTGSASLGGLAFRSMTETLLSGPCLNASPSLLTSIESATSATELVGSIATLTGGPTTEFFSGRLATIFGLSGSARSRITTESFPAGDTIGLPWSSHKSFSSLPTMRNGAAWTQLRLAIARHATALNDKRNECFACMTAFPYGYACSRCRERRERLDLASEREKTLRSLAGARLPSKCASAARALRQERRGAFPSPRHK